jgi:hypothetical protein
MKTIEEILVNPNGPFAREDGRALLSLVEARLRSEQAAWLIRCIRPLEQELEDRIASLQPAADQARAAVEAAKQELEAAMEATHQGGINPPSEVAERRVKANHRLAAAQQGSISAHQGITEAKGSLVTLKRFIEALETFQPPMAGEVQQIIRQALGRASRIGGAVSSGGNGISQGMRRG